MKKILQTITTLLLMLLLDVNCLFSQDNLKCKLAFSVNSGSDEMVYEYLGGSLLYDDDFSDGTNLLGLLDLKGNVIVQPKWTSVSYDDGVLITSVNEFQGLATKDGKTILPESYDRISPLAYGMFSVKKDGKYGMVDRGGNFVLPLGTISTPYVEDYSGFITAFGENGSKDCYFDTEGKESSFSVYYQAKKDGTSSSIEKKGDEYLYGLSRGDGSVILTPQYKAIGKFHDGLATAVKDGKYGYIDKEGTVVVPLKYQNGNDFSCGFAVVTDDKGNKSIIDRTGRAVAEENEDYKISGNKIINGVILVRSYGTDLTNYGYLYIPEMASVPEGFTVHDNGVLSSSQRLSAAMTQYNAYNEGFAFFENKEYAKAYECLKKCYDADPENLDAAYGMGLCKCQTGDLEESLAILKAVKSKDADYTDIDKVITIVENTINRKSAENVKDSYIFVNVLPVFNSPVVTSPNTYTQPQRQICYNCNGTGRVDKIGYATTYGNTAEVWCRICGRYEAAGHYHYQERCRICNGTGYR